MALNAIFYKLFLIISSIFNPIKYSFMDILSKLIRIVWTENRTTIHRINYLNVKN